MAADARADSRQGVRAASRERGWGCRTPTPALLQWCAVALLLRIRVAGVFGTPAAGRTTFRLCVSQHRSRLQIGDGALASLHPSSLRSLLHHRLQVCMASTARTFMAERAGIGRPAALQTGLACRPSTFGCACQGCESFAHTRCSTAGARVRRMQTCTSSEPMAMTGEQNGNGCSSR